MRSVRHLAFFALLTGLALATQPALAQLEGPAPALGAATGTSLALGGTQVIGGGLAPLLEITTTNGGAGLGVSRFSNDGTGPRLIFGKSTGSTGTAGAVVSATDLADIRFYGDDGSTNGSIGVFAAKFSATVSGTVSAGVVPTGFNWQTMNTGGTLAQRMQISPAGCLGVGTTTDCGATNILAAGTLTAVSGLAASGGFAISPRMVATGGQPALSAAGSYTAQVPVVTEFYCGEVFIPANMSVTGIAVFNSATISGNMKVGLANSNGINVATSASTAMSGTSTYQRVAFTGAYAAVGPATYHACVFYDNATVAPNTFTAGNFATTKKTGQTYATGFTSITPATTFTTAIGPVASLY